MLGEKVTEFGNVFSVEKVDSFSLRKLHKKLVQITLEHCGRLNATCHIGQSIACSRQKEYDRGKSRQ